MIKLCDFSFEMLISKESPKGVRKYDKHVLLTINSSFKLTCYGDIYPVSKWMSLEC